MLWGSLVMMCPKEGPKESSAALSGVSHADLPSRDQALSLHARLLISPYPTKVPEPPLSVPRRSSLASWAPAKPRCSTISLPRTMASASQ